MHFSPAPNRRTVSPDDNPTIDAAEGMLRQAMQRRAHRPIIFGLCGAQGSGKSTLASALARRFRAEGVATAILSLDDLYLTRAEREELARCEHPLLITRGVPGTHDVALGLQLLDALDGANAVRIPRFDKGYDDRAPRELWDEAPPDTQLLIFEGWCVGARPQPEATLAEPINALERNEDKDGSWRRFVNEALAGDYQRLFGRIDCLMLLAAPSFDIVGQWRRQQEAELRERSGEAAGHAMRDEEIDRFIQHYERLTRHILDEMPGRADVVAQLADDRSLTALRGPLRDTPGGPG
jgi:D-glycerate 3-kinase